MNSIRAFKYFLNTMAVAYLLAAFLHVFDIFDLRLKFSEMSTLWKVWIVYLLVFNVLVAIGLWKKVFWGEMLFLIVAVSQIMAYTVWAPVFTSQQFLVAFHGLSLVIYVWLKTFSKRAISP